MFRLPQDIAMKSFVFPFLCVALVLTIGCGKITDRYIDSEVEKALAASNSQLPTVLAFSAGGRSADSQATW